MPGVTRSGSYVPVDSGRQLWGEEAKGKKRVGRELWVGS